MDEKTKDQVIERLVTALEFYAQPMYWERMYGGYTNDTRLWIGPGNGYDLAIRALQDTEKERSDG